MSIKLSSRIAIPNKFNILILLVLTTAGLAGNYFRYPIFLNIDFLFGSIFAMLVLQLFGFGRGILAAALIASYTYFIWNHPYAIIIMTAEAVVVSWLMGRHKMGMVLSDTLYWLIIGIPLVYLFYHTVMHVSPSNTYIIMTKQAVNGIANALVARLIYTGYALRSRTTLISYREIVYNQLAFFVLCPSLIVLAVDSRTDFKDTDIRIRASLIQDSQRVAQRLETWVKDRKTAIVHLAELAATYSTYEMQLRLEQAHKSDLNFEIVALLDKEATTTAYSPLIDELGHSTIGKSYADRPYLPTLKETLKPMLTEVAMSRFGVPRPLVRMIAPVVIRGEYGGYVSGVLKLEQIQEYLNKSVDRHSSLYTLIDKNGNVLMTNRPDQKVMMPLLFGKGTLKRLDDKGLSQWMPVVPPNTPISERWKKSFYIAETKIGEMAEWKLILEQPVAPFQKSLYDNYSGKLSLLFLILLGSLALAEFFTRRAIFTLANLSRITRDLPAKLVTDDNTIVWPESGIKETNRLIDNFRDMSEALAEVFAEKQYMNEVLEQRIQERTNELRESEERFRNMFKKHSAMMLLIEPESGAIINSNLAAENFYRYSHEKLLTMNIREINTLSRENIALERQKALDEERNYFIFPHRISGGEIRTVEVHTTPIRLDNSFLLFSIIHDITERRQAEDALREAKEAAESATLAKSRFLSVVAHEFHTPLGLLVVGSDILEEYWDSLTREQQLIQLKQIRNAANQISTLVDSVNIFNRNEIGIPNENSELLDIGQLCRTIASEVNAVWSTGQDFRASIFSESVTVMMNVSLFRRVLENLLTNAFRFTPTEGAVTLAVSHQSDRLLIEVADTGIGIPEDEQESIYNAFFRSSNVDVRGGLGLGLSIVVEALQKMKGTITMTSRVGEGSTFRVELPAVTQTPTPAEGA